MSDQSEEKLPLWKAALGIEFIALLIGLAMPITPTKTGRKTVSLAAWLFGEPSYLMERPDLVRHHEHHDRDPAARRSSP